MSDVATVPASLFSPETTPETTMPPTSEPAAPADGQADAAASPEAKPAEAAPAAEAPAAQELYELPDGRKVDAATLAKEFKENFLPDYTRKSQKLKEFEGLTIKDTTPEPKYPWQDPNWVPQTAQELMEATKQSWQLEQQANEDEAKAQAEAVKDLVNGQLTEIKAKDPQLDEEALFKHANKYGFNDLRQAWQNMQDIKSERETAAKDALDNKTARAKTPVGGAPSNASNESGVDFGRIRSMDMASAVHDFMDRVKGK